MSWSKWWGFDSLKHVVGVRFLTHAYGENSVGRGELTSCAPRVPRRKLVIANDGGNFVSISW
jgi:hypothetical protein